MPKHAARVDDNQKELVADLREMGCSVQHLHTVGQGVPDILVGYWGHNFLLEIKDGSKPPSRRKLTDDEREWHQLWRGQVATVKNLAEAISVIGIQIE
jgi:hypothetical protein